MRNLRELSRYQLAEWTPRERFRFMAGAGMAVAAVVLAFLGQMYRYSSAGQQPPLPGMDHFWGQAAWSAALGLLMIAAAWVVRGVIVMRLQMAVVLSLLLHLLIIFTAQRITLAVPIAELAVEEDRGTELRELTLPDYGGMEAPDSTPQDWQLPEDVSTPEMQLESQARTELDHNVEIERDRQHIEHRTEITEHERMERQQREQEVVPENAQARLERQKMELELQQPERVESPEVQAADSQRQMELQESVELHVSREDSAPASERREMPVESDRQQTPNLLQMQARREELTPEAALEQLRAQQARAAAAARGVDARAEPTEVAMAESARDFSAQQREMEAERLAARGLPGRSEAATSAPSGERAVSVSNSRAPSRAVGDAANLPHAAPSGGGAAQLARSQTGASSTGAAAAQAEGVEVASASQGGGLSVSESSSATLSSRGTEAAVPSRNSGRSPSVGTGNAPRIASSSIAGSMGGRTSAGSGQPVLGAGPGTRTSERSGGGGDVTAVGTNAGNVEVATAAGGGDSGNAPLVGGPSDARVDRQSTGLPGGTGQGRGTVAAPSRGTVSGLVRGPVGDGLAARGTEPSARLGSGGTLDAGVEGALTRRTTMTGALPAASVQAEQSGALVTAGPQADGDSRGTGGLTGPQIASMPRRRAGLPGSSGALTAPSFNSERSGSRPSQLSGSGLTPRKTPTNTAGPSVETHGMIAALLRKSTGGDLQAVETRISGGYAMRRPGLRGQVAETLGGSEASERAVEAGLDWLARHQSPDGRWSIHAFHEQCDDHRCSAPGQFHADTAATGLALLAFYGAAYTHEDGKHQETVRRGLQWLIKGQKPNGDLYQDEAEFVWFYSHGMASIALCEAYGMTKDASLREPAQKAIDFILDSQHPEFGGWRYQPRFETDTSVSGWQLMALKSAEISGLKVPAAAYTGVSKWLDLVHSGDHAGRYKYHPSRPESLAMTAEGNLMRQYLGASRDDPQLRAGADFLLQHLPDMAERDAYYWYYATQVMFHMQGTYWEQWNGALRDMLVETQLKDGGPGGSWNPDRPTSEKWGAAGGRLYVTCLNLLMLEVYYRHLPLYLELNK